MKNDIWDYYFELERKNSNKLGEEPKIIEEIIDGMKEAMSNPDKLKMTNGE
jgi:hypothetical protein